MRALIATETYPPDVNGAAYFVRRLAGALSARGHRVGIVCPAAADARSAFEGDVKVFELASRTVPRYPQVRVARARRARSGAERVLAEFEPDVVHVQNHFAVGRSVAREAHRQGIPVIATNHFLPANLLVYLPIPGPLEGAVERLLWSQVRSVYGRAAIATAPTPYAAEITARECRRPVHAISCGVDEAHFSPGAFPRPFRERYRIPEVPIVLAVGRLDPEKHLDELIEAMPPLHERFGAHLVIVGRGEQRARLEAIASRAGITEGISFCGFVEDELMPSAYAGADVYCHPGRAELQSISTLEALASGLPVVAAEAGALPLLVDPGVNGFLYQPGDRQELAARLGRVLGDDAARARMGVASRELARSHAVSGRVEEFEDLYGRAIAGDVDRGDAAAPRRSGRALPLPAPRVEARRLAPLALALPSALAAALPEAASDPRDLALIYMTAAISAMLSVGALAAGGVVEIPRWLGGLEWGPLRVGLIAIVAAVATTLMAMAARGAL